MDKFFEWREEDHRQHFPALEENKAKKAERELQAKECSDQIDAIKNKLTYPGEEDLFCEK